jgi:hypothetical protein
MTILNLDRANDPVSVSFVNDVGSNMCNIIYECDPVPRFYGNVTFIQALMENAIPQIAGGVPLPKMFKGMFGIQKKIANVLDSAIKSQSDLIKVAEYYRHIGKVIYYEDDESKPVTYIDKGFHHTKPKGSTQNLFYDLKYKSSDDVIGTATTNHLFLVKGPGLAYYGLKKPEEEKKEHETNPIPQEFLDQCIKIQDTSTFSQLPDLPQDMIILASDQDEIGWHNCLEGKLPYSPYQFQELYFDTLDTRRTIMGWATGLVEHICTLRILRGNIGVTWFRCGKKMDSKPQEATHYKN